MNPISPISKRLGVVLGTAAVFVGTALVSAEPAAAIPSLDEFSFTPTWLDNGRMVMVDLSGGISAGYAEWRQDPYNGDPGDAMRVRDSNADGYGIEAVLTYDGRKATTRGHDSPYRSPWTTGDLSEDHTYVMRVCVVRGTADKCTEARVTA
ncbi:hypothetical protein SBI_08069 [Streptomyces bingchenggensis BCW-1]|uniref:Uncharacterized protein n=1 Tax=Streptomyces bingchenggensis (strain BCW-1) TaxID=749414 RepID=D7CGV7_STRBB|nr:MULTISPECIES: hypothetical protein [Streptomyces]ADI11187.1 hypothetical protein SBI_08069 [Streptomyces bingchenggensis BCW-1]